MSQLALGLSIAASLGAAAIHFALGPHHVEELGDLGLGFYLAGILQLALPAALFAARDRDESAFRAIVLAGIATNVAILAAWVVSRVVGLPAGPEPWTPEALGIADSVSAGLEFVVVGASVVLIRGAASTGQPMPTIRRRIQSLAMLPAVGLIAVATGFAMLAPEGVAGHKADGHTHGPSNTHAIEAAMPEPTANHDH